MPSWQDFALVLASFGGVAALIAFAGRESPSGSIDPAGRRRAMHALVGTWAVASALLFQSRWMASIPPAFFTVWIASGRARAAFPETRDDPEASLGLWMFPLGIALLYAGLWDAMWRAPIVAGAATLAYADPVAAAVGKRWGQRHLRFSPHRRTLEGSLAFGIVAAAVAMTTALLMPAPAPAVHAAARAAVGCASVGALCEAVSPRGWDNLAIPLVVAVAFRLLTSVSAP